MSKIITNATELGKAIDAWGKKGQKWAQEGQTLALSCLTRLSEHGDIGYVNRLYLSMPKGTKSSAMASWLLTYGALQANTDKGTKSDKPFVFDKEKITDVPGATADPWFDHKPEPDADQVFDLQKALQAILTKAGKAKQVAHGELAAEIAALLGQDAPSMPINPDDEEDAPM
jgi:hypothetical protein